jgi:hypothetical protein
MNDTTRFRVRTHLSEEYAESETLVPSAIAFAEVDHKGP